MAYDDGRPGRPQRQTPTSPTNNTLSYRISSISDITDIGNYNDEFAESPTLRARESLVSIQSYDSRTTPRPESASRSYSGSSGWSVPFLTSGGGGYEPVSVTGGPARGHSLRNTYSGSTLRSPPDTIDEGRESIDLALLPAAAPMGNTGPYSPLARDDSNDTPAFDWTTSLGPTSSNDPFIKSMQEQEAQGKLTGGLGAGFKPNATMRESELLAADQTPTRTPSRTFSRRRSSLGRTATLKGLAQQQANKRGEVIQVIIEEPEVDISAMTGPDTNSTDDSKMRSSTFPQNKERTEVFYPQPNWKPFSMRWPYLCMLIVLSAGLGAGQECLYRASVRHDGLVKFHSPSDISPPVYFAFKFVPTMVAVLFGVLWQITDFEVKRLEAYYQLSKEGGALAAESINVDYITFFNFLRPVRALRLRHYAVAISSVVSLLAISLVPTLSAAAIILTPDRAKRMDDPTGEKTIRIHPVWSRFLTSTLAIIAALGCVLFWQLQSRKSGLLADVKGIAGLAAMANVSHILMDFKDTDVATHKDIHHKLKHNRYVLRNSSLAPDHQNPATQQERDKYEREITHLSENPHPLMLRAAGMVPFIVGIGVFMALIPIFLFTPAGYLTDRAPWVVTALAVCIKLGWGSVETDVRMMEPFYILSRRDAPPRTLTLDYTAMPFGWVAFKALLNGHFLVFFVGFGSVMAEVLTILVTSLATVEGKDFIDHLRPAGQQQQQHRRDTAASGDEDPTRLKNAGQETDLSFWISLGLATFILFYMAVVAAAVFARRRHPFLPRQPNTIASHLAFIHQSKMLYDFVGTEKLSSAAMARTLEALGKRYGLGWFEGRDGQTHCGVDQEPLMSSYKHGVDLAKSNKPWLDVEWL
ncbi:DUF3433 domain protein [Pleurostoma richardsiae]|uniref:DUF3433 domain protein n=1 Tax=Pleurostoma richardsiae TaxID=41990 RepID=A0AA38SBR6_9PEZI|nr:DUF3433 domain protein [Pleurostoma richardsiae]